MYADTDFLIALIKDEDWLKQAAEEVYRENRGDIWTSRYGILELLVVSYREGWSCTEVLANIEELIDIRDEPEELFRAAAVIENRDMTPLDAVHLVISGDDPIISSDQAYDDRSERLKLEERGEAE